MSTDGTAGLRVGLIGLGPMGHGMGRNILAKGGALTILGHRRRERVESLVALGAAEAADLAALAARSEIVMLCLPSSREVSDVVLGAEGRPGLEGLLAPGSLVVDTSTANPVSTEMLAARLALRGVGLVDAPLTRTPKEAEAGRLNVILGGSDADVERALPLVRHFAENVFRSGPVGSAHRLKLINNFLSIGCSLVVSEAVIAARALGVDTVLLHDLASQGGANSGALQQIMPWVNEGQMSFRFAIRNAEKDIGYFADMLEGGGGTGPVGQAIAQALGEVVRTGRGEAFMPELIDLMGLRPAGGRG